MQTVRLYLSLELTQPLRNELNNSSFWDDILINNKNVGVRSLTWHNASFIAVPLTDNSTAEVKEKKLSLTNFVQNYCDHINIEKVPIKIFSQIMLG